MLQFRFPRRPDRRPKAERRVFFFRKRTLLLPAGLLAACALCLVTTLPGYVSAASTQRQLPIYCVQRDENVCSLTFDAAWGNAILRHTPDPLHTSALCFEQLHSMYIGQMYKPSDG